MSGDKERAAAPGEGESKLFERRDEVLQLFKRGAEFYEELLRENERLRFRNAALEEEVFRLKREAPRAARTVELELKVAELEAERQRLVERFSKVESDNANYAERYAEIEEEHNRLANLYIASYQLHSTLAFPEVVRIVIEIGINLIGIGRLVLYLVDQAEGMLYAVAGDGIGEVFKVADRPAIKVGEGLVGKAVADNKRFLAEPPTANDPILAVLPLMAGNQAVGALVLERFLVQKHAWSQVDFELFNLIGAHGGTSLLASLLKAELPGAPLSLRHYQSLLAEG